MASWSATLCGKRCLLVAVLVIVVAWLFKIYPWQWLLKEKNDASQFSSAQVEDYLKNENWVTRIQSMFDHLNTAGLISADKPYLGPVIDKLEKIITDRPELMQKLRTIADEYLVVVKFTRGIDKQKFTKQIAEFAAAESKKLANRELTHTEKLGGAFFDVLDKNNKGYLTFDEYQTLMTIHNMPADAVHAAFNILDKDKTGKLHKNTFTDADVKFWCVLDDANNLPSSGPEDDLYGANFN